MNDQIQEKNMYWRAGRTSLVASSFSIKENRFGKKHNLFGYDYYLGGVYQSISRLNYHSPPSELVGEFDWRNRHGANNESSPYFDGDPHSDPEQRTGWVTPIVNQYGCTSCWVFGPVAATEAYINLFFNNHDPGSLYTHHLDIDLSELEVLRCLGSNNVGIPCEYTGGYFQGTAFNEIRDDGVHEEDCFPYEYYYGEPASYQTAYNPPCSTWCINPGPEEFIKIHNCRAIIFNSDDDIKRNLVLNGPLSCGLDLQNHVMLLVGYKAAEVGDTVYYGHETDPDIILDDKCPFLFDPIWIFKDSEGGGSNFKSMSFSYSNFTEVVCLTGPIYRPWTPTEILCSDEDGDGYYWWGLGPQLNCPAGCSDLRDCDDWNRDVGPYNTNPNSPTYLLYECTSNCVKYNEVWTIGPSSGSPTTVPIVEDFHLQKDVVIENGYTLSVSADVWISPGVKITVEKGGTLHLWPNGRLTSACNQLWDGIIVEGDGNSQSASQGRVICESNNSSKPIIENAICGLKTLPVSGATYSGAIIDASNTIFRNNLTSVELSKYNQPITMTKFLNCSFETDGNLIDGSEPVQFVMLNELSNSNCVKFEGCNFLENGEDRHIIGIRAHNSYFTCKKNESVIPAVKTTFTRLKYGTYVTNDNPGIGKPFTITDCQFIKNFRGVFSCAVTGAKILSCSFDIPLLYESHAPQYGFTAYGIYLERCNAYHVENNNMIGDSFDEQLPPPGYVATCGIFINNSGPYENEVYRNTLQALHCGIAAYKENRNGDLSGLCLKCNTFIDNGIDIGVFKGSLNLTKNSGIKYDQGVYNTTSNSLSAGNVFSASSFSFHKWDISNTANQIRYNHHNQGTTIYKVQPDNDKVTNTEIHQNISSYYNSSSCPSQLLLDDFEKEDSLRSVIDSADGRIVMYSNELALLTDGGNTPSLSQSVQSSSPPEALEIYSELMAESPYLSDTVMKSAIAKEDVLPNVMIRDILVANPQSAKDDSVMAAIDNRFIPMPDSMYAEILEGENIIGAMDALRMNLVEAQTDYEKSFNHLINIYLFDTLHAGMNDSITNLLEGDQRLSSKYALVFRYLENGCISQADDLISGIPSLYQLGSFQYEEYLQYQAFYMCCRRAVLNSASIAFDSEQVSDLHTIVNSDTNYCFLPTVLARNVLQNAGHLTYSEPLVFDEGYKSTTPERRRIPGITSSTEYLQVFPNPASDYVIVDYRIKPAIKQIRITFSGINGKRLLEINTVKKQDQTLVKTGHLPCSYYLVTLYGDGKPIQSCKISIIR